MLIPMILKYLKIFSIQYNLLIYIKLYYLKMEPNKNTNENQNSIEPIQEEIEKAFCERSYEEVEDGYIDDRGFYTTPNGSFWDDDKTYFNHLGFDRHGGSYDKYGIYIPGPEYDEKTGLYKDQKDLFNIGQNIDENKIIGASISKLREQEKRDEKTIKKYEELVEESEEDDDKSNITFDEEDFKEAYNDVMELEKKNNEKELENKNKINMDVMKTKGPIEGENINNNLNGIPNNNA